MTIRDETRRLRELRKLENIVKSVRADLLVLDDSLSDMIEDFIKLERKVSKALAETVKLGKQNTQQQHKLGVQLRKK
jgi:septal ring factor EnvC (AmiA/AmiB activator)